MSNAIMNFTKGAIAGVVVGTAVGVVAKSLVKPQRSFKRSAGKALQTVGSIIDHIGMR